MPIDPTPTSAQPERSARLHQLDSLRGLAALSVVVDHLIIVFPAVEVAQDPDHLWWLRDTPLRAVWAGNSAVLLFFVLSGFVLSLPFHKRTVPYGPFVVRRAFRIYGAYLVALLLAFVVRACTYTGPIAGLSDGFNRMWQAPVGWRELALNALLVPTFKTYQILPPVWSLVHEMRISLAFPLIMVLARIRPIGASLGVSTGIAVVGILLTNASSRLGWTQDYTMTLYYVPAFVLGAVMARERDRIVAVLGRWKSTSRLALAVLAVLFYTWRWWFLPSAPLLHRFTIVDHSIAILGGAMLIAVALASPRLGAFLGWKPVLAVGLSSYSLYLFHHITILGLLHGLRDLAPVWAPLAASIPLTVACTWAGYRWVELPSIALGKRISDRLLASRGRPA